MTNTIQIIGATSGITTFAGLILGLLGLFILILAILMPVFVYLIYGQVRGSQDAENIRAQTLERIMFAVESINFKMDVINNASHDHLAVDRDWATMNDAL